MQDIVELNNQLQACTKYEPPTRHMVVDSMYYREMFALQGTMLIGATHTKPCYNILLYGKICVGDGEDFVVIEAPQTFITAPGKQKVGYCITDVIWANVFHTDKTELQDIEQELFKEEIYKEK